MCGRFTLKTPLGDWLFELFGEQLSAEFPVVEPRFNIAPTQRILIAMRRAESPLIHLELARWGFLPSWAKDVRSSPPLINARSETLSEKPTFRTAFHQGRCAVIADGYYEWRTLENKQKQPFWIHRPAESPFLMAALASTNRHVDPGNLLRSAAIVTTGSNAILASIHERMPVVLESVEKIHGWISNEPITGEQCVSDLSPAPDDFFVARPVTSWVGNPRHEDARCLQANVDIPVEPDT